MRDIQQNLTSYKIYIENQRSQIFADNDAGLTDPAKLFEGVICMICNIYYETNDFEVFAKSSFPSVDIKSDCKNIVVSVKARQTHLSKNSIEDDLEKLYKSYPQYKSYKYVLQQLCDKPTVDISIENCEIRYFGELTNLFISKPQQLAQLVDIMYRKENNIVSISYLNYLSYRYLNYVASNLKQIYKLDTRKDYSYPDFKIDDFDITVFRQWESFIFGYLDGLWKDLQDKKYLSLNLTSETILLLDSLWKTGHSMNRFNPNEMFNPIGNKTTGDNLIQKYFEDRNPNNIFAMLHNYLIRIYLSSKEIRMYLIELSK